MKNNAFSASCPTSVGADTIPPVMPGLVSSIVRRKHRQMTSWPGQSLPRRPWVWRRSAHSSFAFILQRVAPASAALDGDEGRWIAARSRACAPGRRAPRAMCSWDRPSSLEAARRPTVAPRRRSPPAGPCRSGERRHRCVRNARAAPCAGHPRPPGSFVARAVLLLAWGHAWPQASGHPSRAARARGRLRMTLRFVGSPGVAAGGPRPHIRDVTLRGSTTMPRASATFSAASRSLGDAPGARGYSDCTEFRNTASRAGRRRRA
jgi:hypothetical protein